MTGSSKEIGGIATRYVSCISIIHTMYGILYSSILLSTPRESAIESCSPLVSRPVYPGELRVSGCSLVRRRRSWPFNGGISSNGRQSGYYHDSCGNHVSYGGASLWKVTQHGCLYVCFMSKLASSALDSDSLSS